MNKIYFIIIILLHSGGLYAQKVTINFPFHSEKPLYLMSKNGVKNDTIYSGYFDNKGKIEIQLPDYYRNYRGMVSLNLINGAGIDFIINSESPLITCYEEYPYGGNVIFENSPENESLQKWFTAQTVRQQRIQLLQELERLYEKNNKFYSLLISESLDLQTEQLAFENSLRHNNLYASAFIQMHNFLETDVAELLSADAIKMETVRTFVKDSLDIEALYTSGLWFPILNGILSLYDNMSPYHNLFIEDMSLLLKRSEQDKTYIALAEDIFAICEAMGWNDLEEQLAYFLINDGRINNPTGRLQMLMTLFKLIKGSPVPLLSSGELLEGKVLLVFYESGCGNCENEMMMLKSNYSVLKEKGIEVISISADRDANVFENTAQTFLWQAKYCDLQGFTGDDFRNFGVIGTPTFYLIDENKILLGRYTRLQDIKLPD